MVQAAAKTQHFTRAAPAVHWRYGLAAGATGCGGDPDRAFRPGSGGLTAAAIGAVVRRKQAGAVRREFDRFCQRSCHFGEVRQMECVACGGTVVSERPEREQGYGGSVAP